MKRRIASYSGENFSVVGQKTFPHLGIGSSHQKKSKRMASAQKPSEDTFSVKKWIKIAPQKNNRLSDMVKSHHQNKIVFSDAEESTKKGIPYGFVAKKDGSRLLILTDSAGVAQRFIVNESGEENGEDIVFGAFIEHGKPPIILGTQQLIKKTGADSLFLEYLLQPQKLEEKKSAAAIENSFSKSPRCSRDWASLSPFLAKTSSA